MIHPEPYLQPDPSQDCELYAVAYIGRCLGLDVDAESVRQWHQQSGRMVLALYLPKAHGIACESYWGSKGMLPMRSFGLVEENRQSVASHLASGKIGLAHIHRVAEHGHAIVLLESHADGMLIMDPLSGHIVEPWNTLLGNPHGSACGYHRIEGWYSR